MLNELTHKWSGLLLLLVLAILLEAQIGSSFFTEVLTLSLFTLSLAGSMLLSQPNNGWRTATLLIAGLWYVTSLATMMGAPLKAGSAIFAVILILGSLRATFRTLMSYKKPNVEVLLGAIYGYVLLIAAWAVLYLQIERSAPGSFNLAEGADFWSSFVYFSAVTMTTLGYGDVLPVSSIARVMAAFEAIVGVLYIAVMVGGIVGSYQSSEQE
ncbi:MAG: hypothetical protein GJ676_16385 [Rhodobacteraceae bacterium]|nr:hypothetical protein [Paracoccaceae bacterium]